VSGTDNAKNTLQITIIIIIIIIISIIIIAG